MDTTPRSLRHRRAIDMTLPPTELWWIPCLLRPFSDDFVLVGPWSDRLVTNDHISDVPRALCPRFPR